MKFLRLGKDWEKQPGRRALVKGTTLIELLVVIVIFLVGILAVVQIFPKGLQLLIVTRNNSVASNLANDELERERYHSDQIPDQILAIHYQNGVAVADPGRDPFDLGPQGDALAPDGTLSAGGTAIGDWLHFTGSNSFREIIGEGKRVPSPRTVGNMYGGLQLLNFGPPDPKSPIIAYANDLSKDSTLPQNMESAGTQSVVVNGNSISAGLLDSAGQFAANVVPYQYFVTGATAPTPYVANALVLPTNSQFDRSYHIRLSAYVGTGVNFARQDYPDLSVTVPATTASGLNGTPPLIQVPISQILAAYNLLGTGSMSSVEYDSIQVAPQYRQLAAGDSFDNDPLEFEVLDANVGVLLFSPAGYSTFIETAGGPREPLEARVNYDVSDWRIIKQEFRLDTQAGLNGANYAQFQLALQSIKVGGQTGPDGRPNGGIPQFELSGDPAWPSQQNGPDNFVLVDMQTGGLVCEVDPSSGQALVTVDKNKGLVTINGANGGAGLAGYILLPGATTATQVDLSSRSVRALYLGRNEWSVNVLKAANVYTLTSTNPPAQGQAYVPPNGTRIYFPRSDLHQKITIDKLSYIRANDAQTATMEGQDFSIEYPVVKDAIGLPCIDITSVDPNATGFAPESGAVARGIKGASMIAQVLWNPNAFTLGPNPTANLQAVDKWGRGWRRSSVQTTLQPQEIQ
ncbi:MAG TPA: hypothetical protein VG944_01025 [Fimbriimonas sp.]|nr:hypothetical protein [Fimbriimonas sp.]